MHSDSPSMDRNARWRAASVRSSSSSSTSHPPPLSKKEANKRARKRRKLEAKAAHAARVRATLGCAADAQPLHQQRGFTSSNGGKEARAREARRNHATGDGGVDSGGGLRHRAAGGPARTVLPEHRELVAYLESVEAGCRGAARPTLVERKPVPMDNHGTMDVPRDAATLAREAACAREDGPGACASLRMGGLRGALSLTLLPSPLAALRTLDLSRNELWELPGLAALSGLTSLNIARNWFAALPESLVALTQLQRLDASYNMLRATPAALRLDDLTAARRRAEEGAAAADADADANAALALRFVDVRFNSKLGKKRIADAFRAALGARCTLHISTNWDGTSNANFDGASAAERDATQLRAQLEPWGTTALRRRLVADFGEDATDPAHVPRAEVMRLLLAAHAEDAAALAALAPAGTRRSATSDSSNARVLLHVDGAEVSLAAREALLLELRRWAAAKGSSGAQRERPSIRAESYMILSAPQALLSVGSLKASKGLQKLEAHQHLWDLAHAAMVEVDPTFAAQYSALAVTRNFEGSPHIDKQNVGPFYGMALGSFPSGTGGIRVECSARVVCDVNTKNRLGKVDGRFPHWVATYPKSSSANGGGGATSSGVARAAAAACEYERFSLIYYRTLGGPDPSGPAVFAMPRESRE